MSEWQTGMDPLFGPYRERIVKVKHKADCFACGGIITEQARERERGGTRWLLHIECEASRVRKRKKP